MIQRLANRQRLPRIGKIKLGVTVTKVDAQGKEVTYPTEVPYFVIPPELGELYGARPTRLPILFPVDDIDRILPNRYERYSGGLLTLDCDGVQATEIPLKGPEVRYTCKRPMAEPGKPTPECECGAKAKGMLNVIVRGGGIGTYQIPIGGEARISDLITQLDVFKKIFGSLTTINGHPIPFEIVRVPQTAQIRNGGANGERLTREGYPVKIECRFTVEQALEARGMRMLEAAPPGQEQRALPSTVGATVLQRAEPAEQPSLLDEPEEMDDVPQGPIEQLRADLETLFSDAAGGNRTKMANLIRKTVMQHTGEVVEGLGDLDEGSLRKVMAVMSR